MGSRETSQALEVRASTYRHASPVPLPTATSTDPRLPRRASARRPGRLSQRAVCLGTELPHQTRTCSQRLRPGDDVLTRHFKQFDGTKTGPFRGDHESMERTGTPRDPLGLALRIPELAQLLGCTKVAARRMIERRLIPARRLGRRVVVLRDELETYLRNLPPR